MSEIALFGGHVLLFDEADHAIVLAHLWTARSTGSRPWYAGRQARKPDGSRETIYLHRALLSPAAGLYADHVNGNGLDNRRVNLRVATPTENARNCAVSKRSTSGYRGVEAHHGLWRARLFDGGKAITLGRFETPEEAARACDAEAILRYGEFARLNFPREVA